MLYIINKNQNLHLAIEANLATETMMQESPYDIVTQAMTYHMEHVRYIKPGEKIHNLVPNRQHTFKVWITVRKRMVKVLLSFIGNYAEKPQEPLPSTYKLTPGTIIKKDDQKYLVAGSQQYMENTGRTVLFPLVETAPSLPYYSDSEEWKREDTDEWSKKWINMCLEVHDFKLPLFLNSVHSLYGDVLNMAYPTLEEVKDYELDSFISSAEYKQFCSYYEDFLAYIFKTQWNI
jgi:hypothetical protein